jgi:competence protein ComEC
MTNVVVALVDVGQGDCVLAVDRESGEALLVDCPEGRHRAALAALQDFGARRLNTAVVTHQHLDHLGGVYAVATSCPTSCIRVNPATHVPADRDERRKLRAALRAIAGLPRHNIATIGAYAEEEGAVGQLRWRVVAPDHSQMLDAQATSSPNHASIVMKLHAGACTVLLGSDADAASWTKIIARGSDIAADVFQLPHHGASMTGEGGHISLAQVLDVVCASYHLISVGSRNSYGHPARSTLADIRARRGRAQTLCTQLNAVCAGRAPGADVSCAGTVAVWVTDATMSVSTSVGGHRAAVSALPAAQCV